MQDGFTSDDGKWTVWNQAGTLGPWARIAIPIGGCTLEEFDLLDASVRGFLDRKRAELFPATPLTSPDIDVPVV